MKISFSRNAVPSLMSLVLLYRGSRPSDSLKSASRGPDHGDCPDTKLPMVPRDFANLMAGSWALTDTAIADAAQQAEPDRKGQRCSKITFLLLLPSRLRGGHPSRALGNSGSAELP